MLITDPAELTKYKADQRIWQGIPSIEVTKQGRIFVTFYSGGTGEEIGNYALIIQSDDGIHFSEPIAAASLEDHRCYDPCLWIDPLGRLWFTWSICPDDGLYGSICDDPDGDVLTWSEPFLIGHDIMMNKPTVLTTGEWLFPVAVWDHGIRALPPAFDSKTPDKGSFVYKTSDNGKTFQRLGVADVPGRHFDEHMVVELTDGRLWMLVRTFYGIGQSFSHDRGKTWSAGHDSRLGGPSSRFHITRLRSGRILLINHVDYTHRNNLTALLSEDDGKTWQGKLLLDGRNVVAYPDAKEGEDGFIYIVYDRERGGSKRSVEQASKCAREILLAKITEADILQGKLVTPGSVLQQIVTKLGVFNGKKQNLYDESLRYSDQALTTMLMRKYAGEEILLRLFDTYRLSCSDQNLAALRDLDHYIEDFTKGGWQSEAALLQIVRLIRGNCGMEDSKNPTAERVVQWLQENIAEDVSVAEIAERLKISQYYMCHMFKQYTGITISDYRNALRLRRAKDELIHTTKSITEIAMDVGYQSASYFGDIFRDSENMSPTAYRKLHRSEKTGG